VSSGSLTTRRTHVAIGLTVAGAALVMSGAIMTIAGTAMRLKPHGGWPDLLLLGVIAIACGLGCGVALLFVVTVGRRQRGQEPGRDRGAAEADRWLRPFRSPSSGRVRESGRGGDADVVRWRPPGPEYQTPSDRVGSVWYPQGDRAGLASPSDQHAQYPAPPAAAPEPASWYRPPEPEPVAFPEPEPEPVPVPEPEQEPVAMQEPESAAAPEPVAGPEQPARTPSWDSDGVASDETVPMPVIMPDLPLASQAHEPVAEPEPAFTAEPVAEPEPAFAAEPVADPEPAFTAEPVAQALTAEPVAQALTAEPAVQPETAFRVGPAARPERAATPPPVVRPDMPAAPPPVVRPEPPAALAPVARPGPSAAPAPAAQPQQETAAARSRQVQPLPRRIPAPPPRPAPVDSSFSVWEPRKPTPTPPPSPSPAGPVTSAEPVSVWEPPPRRTPPRPTQIPRPDPAAATSSESFSVWEPLPRRRPTPAPEADAAGEPFSVWEPPPSPPQPESRPYSGPDSAARSEEWPDPAQSAAAELKLEQIKDLYLTAEAIGEDALAKHFNQLSEQQRELIRQYFQQSRAGRGEAPGRPGDGYSTENGAPISG
jgi:hypothetical protein